MKETESCQPYWFFWLADRVTSLNVDVAVAILVETPDRGISVVDGLYRADCHGNSNVAHIIFRTSTIMTNPN